MSDSPAREIRYSYRDAPTVKQFSASNAFLRGLVGPFGSGKSTGCVIEIIKRSMEQAPGKDGIRRSRWVVIRNTYGQLEDTTIRTFHQWVPPHIFGTWKVSDHQYLIEAFEGVHIEILFRALDRPDHVRNLLSLELTGAWVNEAREVPWAIIEALQGRVGRYPAMMDGGSTWCGIIMDTNPPDEDSWWFDLFETKRPSNVAIFKQPSGRSPQAENLKNLRPNYYTDLAITMREDRAKVYIDGQYGFVTDGKAVFPEYNDTIHCKEVDPILDEPVYRGWDFGLTPAVAMCQVLPNGQFIVFDEMVSTDMGIERFSDQVLEYCNTKYSPRPEFIDIGDPAGQQRAQTDERTCYQILQAKGINIEPGLQTLAIRLESIRKPLSRLVGGQPGFILHPRCKVSRKGYLGAYQFRRMQVSTERYTDQPEKNAVSHVMDAQQYVGTRIFGEALMTMDESKQRRRYQDDDDDFTFAAGRSQVTGY